MFYYFKYNKRIYTCGIHYFTLSFLSISKLCREREGLLEPHEAGVLMGRLCKRCCSEGFSGKKMKCLLKNTNQRKFSHHKSHGH